MFRLTIVFKNGATETKDFRSSNTLKAWSKVTEQYDKLIHTDFEYMAIFEKTPDKLNDGLVVATVKQSSNLSTI